MFKEIVLIIIAISITFIGIFLTSNLWFFHKEEEIGGSKEFVVNEILRKVYECFERNNGARKSIICFDLMIKSNEEIFCNDIKERIDEKKINPSNIFCEDLGKEGKVIIRYENGKIFVESEKYERIGP